jgi:hypothetical protein
MRSRSEWRLSPFFYAFQFQLYLEKKSVYFSVNLADSVQGEERMYFGAFAGYALSRERSDPPVLTDSFSAA